MNSSERYFCLFSDIYFPIIFLQGKDKKLERMSREKRIIAGIYLFLTQVFGKNDERIPIS